MITHENIEIIHYFLQVDKAPFKAVSYTHLTLPTIA